MIYGPDGETPADVQVKLDNLVEFEVKLHQQLESNDGQLWPPDVMEKLINALDQRGDHRAKAREEAERPSNAALRPVIDEYDDKVKDRKRGPILISIPAEKEM